MNTTHIDSLSEATQIHVEIDGIVFHTSAECNGAQQATIPSVYGLAGKFPCGTCIDVDAMPQPLVATTSYDSVDAPDQGTGTGARKPGLAEGEVPTLEEAVALVDGHTHGKFDVTEMTTGLVEFANGWLKSYTGDFDFLVDLKAKGRALTPGQAKGVWNCIRAARRRGEFGPAPEAAPEAVATGLDLSSIPSGRYAVPGGDTRLKVRIDNVEKGKWVGWVFVKDGAEYGAEQRYGSQKPGATYTGDIEDELRIIAADPKAAAVAYGQLTGRCCVCGRKLEDESSVEAGIGPICAQKF